MNLISSLNCSFPAPTTVALGCFDGVHLGHAEVLKTAVSRAKQLSCPCVVWTFDEPPKKFFSPDSVSLLTDPWDKQTEIERFGVNTLVSVPFNREIGDLSAEAFFQTILCQRLHAVHLVCGYNYTFGQGGAGTVSLLQTLCAQADIGLSVVPPILKNGNAVSSSAIRQALEQGNPKQAAELLGRPYSVRSEVIHGQHLATKLGFPTANQRIPNGRVIPKAGVYAVRATVGQESTVYCGIGNVGTRPTVSDHTLCCETHLFDCSESLYGKQLTVEFLAFLRPEQKFESTEALARQVRADIQTAHSFFKSQGALQ